MTVVFYQRYRTTLQFLLEQKEKIQIKKQNKLSTTKYKPHFKPFSKALFMAFARQLLVRTAVLHSLCLLHGKEV